MQSTRIETYTPNLSATLAMLAQCQGVTVGECFLLTIGRDTYPAVRYSQTRAVHPGCRAYTEGQRFDTVEALYVLSETLPASWRHNPGSMSRNGLRFAFNAERDARAASGCAGVWYVAGHFVRADIDALRAEQPGLDLTSGKPTLDGAPLAHFLLFRETSAPVGDCRTMIGRARTL